jgi:phosphoribosylformimino-5-aminoimidazole carboxamide ribotide isomerase
MRVIGVLDLIGGKAVHARAGRRHLYEPLRAVGGRTIEPGNALAVARAYLEELGVPELYAADLDAIRGGMPQDTVVQQLAAAGPPLWLDAGVSSADRASHALRLGAARVIVGLETLSSYDALARICDAVDGRRVAFSLDLKDGRPVVLNGGRSHNDPPDVIAARAADAGAGTVIVIDLARVGMGGGPDFELIARVRYTVPTLMLLAGGGIRGLDDLARLADSGCDGALVATALHDGRLCAAGVAAAIHRSPTR